MSNVYIENTDWKAIVCCLVLNVGVEIAYRGEFKTCPAVQKSFVKKDFRQGSAAI